MKSMILALALTSVSSPTLEPITKVDYKGGMDLEVTVDPTLPEEFKVTVSGDNKAVKNVIYSRKNGFIFIKVKGWFWGKRQSERVVHVKIRDLDRLRFTGAGDVKISGSTERLKINAYGRGSLKISGDTRNLHLRKKSRGNVEINGVRGEYIYISGSGSGVIKLRGEVARADIRVSQRAVLDATELAINDNVDLYTAGLGELSFCLKGKLGKSEVFGAFDVWNRCINPRVENIELLSRNKSKNVK